VDSDEWTRAFQNALRTSTPIEIHDPDGRTLAINPHQILFWEEIPDATATQSDRSGGQHSRFRSSARA
jgi:hypothetical protein